MTDIIVKDPVGVTLLGGGEANMSTLKEALTIAPSLVAADGAAKRALETGLMPEAVIGDFDSLDSQSRAWIPSERLHHIPTQDSTDFEKCLTHVDAPRILGIGFTGRRSDHELAVYNAMVRHPHLNIILISARDVCLHLPRRLTLDVEIGTRVSLFPMASVTGRSQGLRWEIGGIDFAPNGRIGTSNEATAQRVVLETDGDGMLLFVPRSALGTVLEATRGL